MTLEPCQHVMNVEAYNSNYIAVRLITSNNTECE